jgi:hypothetical protein
MLEGEVRTLTEDESHTEHEPEPYREHVVQVPSGNDNTGVERATGTRMPDGRDRTCQSCLLKQRLNVV